MYTLPWTLTRSVWKELVCPRDAADELYMTTKTDGVHVRLELSEGGEWTIHRRGCGSPERGKLGCGSGASVRVGGGVFEGELVAATGDIVLFASSSSSSTATLTHVNGAVHHVMGPYTLRAKPCVPYSRLFMLPPSLPGVPIDGYILQAGPRVYKWKQPSQLSLDFAMRAGSSELRLSDGSVGGRLDAPAETSGIGECVRHGGGGGSGSGSGVWRLVKLRGDKSTANDPEVAARTHAALDDPLTTSDLLRPLPWGRLLPVRPRVAIIVPYRDRAEHAAELVPVLCGQIAEIARGGGGGGGGGGGVEIRILLVEQAPGAKFNRGALLNAGFLLTRDAFDWFIFHDVDLIPSDALVRDYYAKPGVGGDPLHIGALWKRYNYGEYFGGVTAFSRRSFEALNGFPNNFFGWGGEDDVLYDRFVRHTGSGVKHTVPDDPRYTLTDLEDLDWPAKKATLSDEVRCTAKKALVRAAKNRGPESGSSAAADGLGTCPLVVLAEPEAAEGYGRRVLKVTVGFL